MSGIFIFSFLKVMVILDKGMAVFKICKVKPHVKNKLDKNQKSRTCFLEKGVKNT